MMPPADDIVRRLCGEIAQARGELVIGTAELEERIGLTGDARHTATLVGSLDKAKEWFARRGFDLEWSFFRSEIAVVVRVARPLRLVGVGGR